MRAILLALFVGACLAGEHSDDDFDLIHERTDEEKTISERLNEISIDMWHLHDDLREDRHDKPVAIQGEAIRKRLQKIIDDAEEANAKGGGSGRGAPLKDSKLDDYDANGDRIWKVKKSFDARFRDNIADSHVDLARPIIGLGDYREIHGVWGRRIAAYFLSVVCERDKPVKK